MAREEWPNAVKHILLPSYIWMVVSTLRSNCPYLAMINNENSCIRGPVKKKLSVFQMIHPQ